MARRGPRPGGLPNGVAGLESDEKERGGGSCRRCAEPRRSDALSELRQEVACGRGCGRGHPQLFTAACSLARASGARAQARATPRSMTSPAFCAPAPGKRGDLAGSSSGAAPRALGVAAPVFGPGGTPGAVLPTTFGTRRLRFADQATPQLLRSGLGGGRSVAGRGGTPYPTGGGGAGGGLFSTPSTAGRPQTGRPGTSARSSSQAPLPSAAATFQSALRQRGSRVGRPSQPAPAHDCPGEGRSN